MAVHIAKVFMSGNSQAIRLPKEFRVEGNEVYIKKDKQGIYIFPLKKKQPGSFKELMDGLGIPPPVKGVDYYKELFGIERPKSPPRPVGHFDD